MSLLALISGLALPILALRLWPGPTVRDLQRVPLGRVRAGVQGVRRLRVLWALCVWGADCSDEVGEEVSDGASERS